MRALHAALVGVTLVTAPACRGGSSSPDSPTALSPGPTQTPAPASATFLVDLPVAAGDTAAAAYGLWPFGVHGSSHAADGHPGFDVEFRIGASVRAAADGSVASVAPDSNMAGRFTVRLSHTAGGRTYATDYTNIDQLAAGIAAGATVTRGQALGLAGAQSQVIGTASVTWAMTHFQVNDFSRNEGLTNPNAVSPESVLTPGGRALLDTIWTAAAYAQELTEPFVTNDRATPFPLTRTWTTTESTAVPRLDISRADATSTAQAYAIRTAAGDLVESGTVSVTPRSGLSSIDLVTSTGATRRGVYDVSGSTLRLNLGTSGAARPASLSGAAVYQTR